MDDSIYVAEDVVNEILLRSPVKSLLRFKCVCKNWYSFIKNPNFVQQHLKKNHSEPQLLIYDSDTDDDDDDDDDDDSHGITLISEENPQKFVGMKVVMGYVDGLFLMYGITKSAFSCALWNPATREMRPLHIPSPIIDGDDPEFGLGIDPLTNDYKVICFLSRSYQNQYAAVYSCCRDSWRIFKTQNFNEPPFYLADVKNTFGSVHLNEAYYWLLSDEVYSCIILFDFGSEMFEKIQGPEDHSDNSFPLGIMLFDDSIAILKCKKDHYISRNIWIMIQPGVWNKLFTFQCFQHIKSCYDSSLIFVTRASRLVSFNVRTNKTKHLGFQHSRLRRDDYLGRDPCKVFYYKESLVTIKRPELDY